MPDKMQPGRFTLRFNLNDPQQQAAVDILNRLGRQKAQFLAQALIYYTEYKEPAPTTADRIIDPQMLEQAVLSVLAKHPQFTKPGENTGDTAIDCASSKLEASESLASDWNDFMNEENLDAINKTLAAFRCQ